MELEPEALVSIKGGQGGDTDNPDKSYMYHWTYVGSNGGSNCYTQDTSHYDTCGI